MLLNVVLIAVLSSCSLVKTEGPSGESYLGKGLELNLEVQKFQLENGLRLLVIENNQLPIFSYYTFYDVGGRHEGEGTTGATHFLEHMMFKGSKKYGPGTFDDNIERRGGSNNAYTSFDTTAYYENLPSGFLDMIVDMEADRMENLLLVPESVERERNVIFEERKMRYENSPHGKLYLKIMQAVFEGTPYGGSVIGEVEDLRKLKRQNLVNFYNTFYRPNNAVIVVAGDVKAHEVHRIIKEKMGGFSFSTELVEYKKTKDNPRNFQHRGRYKRDIKLKASNPLPIFAMAFKGVELGGRKGFTLDLLASVLGDGESSYFSQKFIKSDKPVMSSIDVVNYTLKYNGVFFIMGQLVEGITPQRAKRLILRELRGICGRAVTDRSIQKTRNRYLVGQFHEIQTNMGVASFIGTRELFFGDFNFYKKELEAYRTITPQEVRKECESLFESEEYLYASVWNKH